MKAGFFSKKQAILTGFDKISIFLQKQALSDQYQGNFTRKNNQKNDLLKAFLGRPVLSV